MPTGLCQTWMEARDYDLDETLDSGQAFRWRRRGEGWDGVIGGRWVRLTHGKGGWTATATKIANTAEAAAAGGVSDPEAIGDWTWLRQYLQVEVDLNAVLATFPDDAAMQSSVQACRGLRLLRQEPWECLVSFICSATKQVVQIQQIVDQLAARFGDPIPADSGAVRAFPSPSILAAKTEAELRQCKMGFRAPYVLGAARAVAEGRLDLERLRQVGFAEARAGLMELAGVGEKIANCVLLYSYGYPEAFPVDVWIMRALRELYFPKRRPSPARLRRFVETYFGPNSGYAQQYLFHYMRRKRGKAPPGPEPAN